MSTVRSLPRRTIGATPIPLVAILLVPFLWSCDNYVAATGKAKVKLHDDLERQERYCKYKVATPIPTGAALKEDDVICILCPSGKAGCDDYSEVEEADGVTVYKVKALTKGLACVECPKGSDKPPGTTRKMR